MTFEELKAMLEKAEGIEKDSVLEGVLELVNEEKSKGIALYQKKDGELLKLKASIKEAGYDSSKHETIKDFVKSLSEKASTSETDKLTINTLNEKLSDLENKWTEASRKQQEAETKANKESLKSKLTTVIGDKVYGSKYVIDSLIDKGEVRKIDGRDVWSVDGTDLEFDAGLDKFLKSNSDILKSTKTNGTGEPGSTVSTKKDNSELSVEEASARIHDLAKEYGVKI